MAESSKNYIHSERSHIHSHKKSMYEILGKRSIVRESRDRWFSKDQRGERIGCKRVEENLFG